MKITIALIYLELGLPIILSRSPFKCRPFSFREEPFLAKMMYSLMARHTHSVRAIQRYNNPRLLLSELLVKSSPSKARTFRNCGDLIWSEDLGCRSNPSKFIANSFIKFDLMLLKLWAIVESGVLLINGLTTNLLE